MYEWSNEQEDRRSRWKEGMGGDVPGKVNAIGIYIVYCTSFSGGAARSSLARECTLQGKPFICEMPGRIHNRVHKNMGTQCLCPLLSSTCSHLSRSAKTRPLSSICSSAPGGSLASLMDTSCSPADEQSSLSHSRGGSQLSHATTNGGDWRADTGDKCLPWFEATAF